MMVKYFICCWSFFKKFATENYKKYFNKIQLSTKV